jgi:D-sedoheptulose 7-phosphate isomerase
MTRAKIGNPDKRASVRLKARISHIFDESMRLKENFLKHNLDVLEEVVRSLALVLKQGNKILFFGNGGSAADAQHLAAEFVNRYLIDRPPLAALALTTDTSVLTAIANDFSYTDIFAKQIRALAKPGDAAVGISTSGGSINVIRGLETAKAMGLVAVGVGGPSESPMKEASTYYLPVEGACTPRIQETHLLLGHTLVEMIEYLLYERDQEPCS